MNHEMISDVEGKQGSTDTAENIVVETAKKILVIDDELFQLQKVHVQQAAPQFYETISDVTDPNFDDLWSVAKAVPNLGADEWDLESAQMYFDSDEAVTKVLLSQQFNQVAGASLKQLVASFTARAALIEQLKQAFISAFPYPQFDLRFEALSRPQLDSVIQCDAVFLDLFLDQGDPSPVETLQNYLYQLTNEAGAAELPPLVLMSSHHELDKYKRNFSEKASISAAGLMVLPKDKIMAPEFGAPGLGLAFKQLDRQRKIAHAMRLFVSAWLSALEAAKEKAARTLWNLDASAMQQIHLAAVSDDDPYDEHLNELLSREHLFHVEADKNVALKTSELDKHFRGLLDSNGKVARRLIAPMTDIDSARAFMSHFAWLGSPLPESFISDEQDAASRISRSLPFGSVLCSKELSHGGKCIVHITQQCDLNSISRKQNATYAITFATAEVCELQPSDNPITKTTELVVKNFRSGEGEALREFDLRINVGDLVALPLSEFLEKARTAEWKVIGRLRSDITNQIVALTTNHMSRPASQKMIRPALHRSKVFLQHASFAQGKNSLMDESTKKSKIFSLSRDDDIYSFQDESCIEIALWVAYELKSIGLQLDPDELSDELSRGWQTPGDLPGGLKVRVRECEDLDKGFRGIVPGDINTTYPVQLTAVVEK